MENAGATAYYFSAAFLLKSNQLIPGIRGVDDSFAFDSEFTEIQKALSNAKLQASGELLRMFIKHPWFRDKPV